MNRKRAVFGMIIGSLLLVGWSGAVTGWAQDQDPPKPGTIDPEPGPEPGPNIPFYYPKFWVNPERPTNQDNITVTVEGSLPDTAHSITETSVTMEGEFIYLNMTVVSSGVGAEVLTPARVAYNISPLKDGYYVAMLRVNGIDGEYTKFVVGNPDPIDPNPDPEPVNPPYGAIVIVEPGQPKGDEPFTIFLEGRFPSPGYEFTSKDMKVEDHVVWINATVKEPAEPQPAVVVQYREEIGALSLPEGEYKVAVFINGNHVESHYLPVGNYVIEDDGNTGGGERDETLLVYDREGGFTGSAARVEIYTNQNFYRQNSLFMDKRLDVGRLEEAVWAELIQLLSEVNFGELQPVYKPTVDTADGYVHKITYKEKTVIVFDGAELPDSLARIVQLLSMTADRVSPVRVKYEKQGGIAGMRSWVELLDNGRFLRYNSLNMTEGQVWGKISDETFNKLYDALARANFTELPEAFKPEFEVADGIAHTITYENHTVTVYTGAEIPPALEEVIQLLDSILITAPAAPAPGKDAVLTVVESWVMY